MKRKFILFVIFMLLFNNSINLFGFCVHNNTDVKISVVESAGGKNDFRKFKAILNPGEKSCCHWSNKDCNKEGKRDSLLYFEVRGAIAGSDDPKAYLICDKYIKAGGDLIVEGKKNQYYRCIGKDY